MTNTTPSGYCPQCGLETHTQINSDPPKMTAKTNCVHCGYTKTEEWDTNE